MKKTFGKTLRELRRSKDVSQRKLADKVSVDFSYISKLENDRLPPPSADTIVKICSVLKVMPDELLALSGKVPNDLKDVLVSSPTAVQFARVAKELKLNEEEWEELVKKVKQLRE